MQIIHHARETQPLSKMILTLPPPERADIEGKIAEVDPLRFAAGLKEKARQGKVMMINAAEDEVIPRACSEKLAAAMEMGDRVEWIQGLGHYTSMAELPRVLKATAEFFAQDLPPGAKPPVVEKQDSPFQAIAGVCAQIAAILDTKPEPGRCHIVDLDVKISRMDQTRQEGHFRLVRGAGQVRVFLQIAGRDRHFHRAERSSLDGDRGERGLRRDGESRGRDLRIRQNFRSQAGGPAQDALRRARKRGTCTGRSGPADNGQRHGRRGLFGRSQGNQNLAARGKRKRFPGQCADCELQFSGWKGGCPFTRYRKNIRRKAWHSSFRALKAGEIQRVEAERAGQGRLFQPPADLPARKVDEVFFIRCFSRR